MAKDNYWVYVLRNPAGKFYIGLTEDVARRLNDHNIGRSKWTKKFGPWELVWQEGPMTLTEARKLENRWKRQRGGRGFFALTQLQARTATPQAWPREAGFRSVPCVPDCSTSGTLRPASPSGHVPTVPAAEVDFANQSG